MGGDVVKFLKAEEDRDETLLRLMRLEEQLAYAYARASVLHRIKAKEFRDVLYNERFEQ